MEKDPIETRRRDEKVKICCLAFLFLLIVIFSYQTDDAYHSHKMSINFANGDGLVYNVGERANASTCPLLTILIGILYKAVGNVYTVSLLTSYVFSMGAICLLFKRCTGKADALFAAVLLALCRSFLSFTTSGLENSLLFLLFAMLLTVFLGSERYGKRRLFAIFLLTGLIAATRMDALLLTLPLLAATLARRERTGAPSFAALLLAGLSPFILWECFSLVYYGFPFPNTAYAKLGTGLPLTDYLARGLEYYAVSFIEDPLVLAIPILFIAAAFRRGDARCKAVALGIALYGLYILYIGGDFMAGRHFTVPFFMGVYGLFSMTKFDFRPFCFLRKRSEINCPAVRPRGIRDMGSLLREEVFGVGPIPALRIRKRSKLRGIEPVCVISGANLAQDFFRRARRREKDKTEKRAAANAGRPAAIVVCACILLQALLLVSGRWPALKTDIFGDDVIDERAFYFQTTSLLRNYRVAQTPITEYRLGADSYATIYARLDQARQEGAKGIILGGIGGIVAVYGGADLYLSDGYALADPFLARCPIHYEANWRIGHMSRQIPAGYVETIQSGENRLADPNLREYYDILRRITRGDDLFSRERLKLIWDFNRDVYDDLIETYTRLPQPSWNIWY
jgi:hypothetical protein